VAVEARPRRDGLIPPSRPRVAETLLAEPGQKKTPLITPIFRDRSFWGMTATQFLGAFNDKPVQAAHAVAGHFRWVPAAVQVEDQQWYAMMVFSLPFVLFLRFRRISFRSI